MSRFREPSTWAGFAAIIIGIKPFLPAQYGGFFDLAAGALGGLAVLLREQSGR
jgi:hypothetical protein